MPNRNRPIHVLLVEDNPADVDLARETLELGKLKIELSVAKDGVQALDLLNGGGEDGTGRRPDLVLLDLNLPRVDGREVLSEMKSNPALRLTPVVVLTSSDAEKDVVESYGLGANCYVTKPVGLSAFQRIVASVEDFWFTVVKLPPRGGKWREDNLDS